MSNQGARAFPFLLLSSFLLTACGADEHTEIKAWMDEQSASIRGRVAALPQIKTFPVVDYDNGGLMLPFSPEKLDPEKRASGKSKAPAERRKEPLEAFPLESLKMVGMMMMANRPVALIKSENTIYRVQVGNYLGQNFGVITQVSENGLTLKELIEDANGDWVERVSTIALQEQEASK